MTAEVNYSKSKKFCTSYYQDQRNNKLIKIHLQNDC